MAVGMSPVHWQLAGSSALAHHSIPIPVSVPRGRDHGLRIPPASGGEGIFIPIDRIYAESLRQGYDWDEQSLRPIPSLDTDGESLVEEAEAGSTRVVTATFLMDDFSPSLYYKGGALPRRNRHWRPLLRVHRQAPLQTWIR